MLQLYLRTTPRSQPDHTVPLLLTTTIHHQQNRPRRPRPRASRMRRRPGGPSRHAPYQSAKCHYEGGSVQPGSRLHDVADLRRADREAGIRPAAMGVEGGVRGRQVRLVEADVATAAAGEAEAGGVGDGGGKGGGEGQGQRRRQARRQEGRECEGSGRKAVA